MATDTAAEGTENGFLAAIENLARQALPHYGFGDKAGITLLNHSENVTWRIDENGRRAVLRIHRAGYHSKAAIGSELAWVEALRETGGIETAAVVPAVDGARIVTLSSPALPEPRHAVMFEFLEGEEPLPDALLNEAGPLPAALFSAFEQLGEVNARLHAHARAWRRPPGFERHVWDYEGMFGDKPIWGFWREGIGVTGEAEAILGRLADTLRERLGRFGKGPDRFGLIHADLRLANLLVHDGSTRVIDFDDCGFGWFAYDLGAALSFIEHRPEVPELIERWVTGYSRAGALAPEEVAELPSFVLMRRLLLVAWIGTRRETDLAKSQGQMFTEESCRLAEDYLTRFG